ncbi:HNH endonuclease signature motif containing protein [Mycolicibacterium madagascariense]|uniref:HNH endonuclease signature motif containing protein n=1 Tax=Mycolicibacterium madagascariense TaxID=212765 RepID=UPI0021F39D05|nr:HNH endonuclease signature motif containing protein [Mycolicibacterium madagascariense]
MADREGCEASLALQAPGLTPEELKKVADKLLTYLDQDGPEPDDTDPAPPSGSLALGPQRADGMSVLSGELDPEARAVWEAIYAKLAAPGMCNREDPHPCVSGTPSREQIEGDHRSLGRRQLDAMVAVGRMVLQSGTLGQHNGLPVTVIISTTLAMVAVGRMVLQSGTLGQHNGLPVTVIISTTLQDLEAAAGLPRTPPPPATLFDEEVGGGPAAQPELDAEPEPAASDAGTAANPDPDPEPEPEPEPVADSQPEPAVTPQRDDAAATTPPAEPEPAVAASEGEPAAEQEPTAAPQNDTEPAEAELGSDANSTPAPSKPAPKPAPPQPAPSAPTPTPAPRPPTSRTAVTAGGTVLPMRDVIRMASHAYHYLTVFDRHTNEVLYCGRTKRIAPPAHRIVLYARDRGCTKPGCTVPAYGTQVHHVNGWAKNGGLTNVNEEVLACPPDNRLAEYGWTVTITPQGVQWIPPPELDTGQPRLNYYHHPLLGRPGAGDPSSG